MKNYLGNAFSLNMLKDDCDITIKTIKKGDIPQDVISVVGHEATSQILTNELGFNVAFNRATLTLEKGDILYIGQYRGPRLEEGTTILPQGATIEYKKVTIK